MNVRRSAAVLAAIAVIGVATPAVAASPSPSPSVVIPSGLYGSTDPTYDGVWRQSLALLAQDTVGVKPAAKAVDWLTGQQCANGSFAAFRADPSGACDAKLMVDTNSTGAAIQALTALGGHDTETGRAVAWLKSVQNKDGGWGYNAGAASDTNSTSVAIGALTAVGEKPAEVVKDGQSPYDALLKLTMPCKGDSAGAFSYQPDGKGDLASNANEDATAAGVLGALGKGFVVKPGKTAEPAACADGGYPAPQQAAANGASYLAKAVAKDGYVVAPLAGAPDQPDYGNTADAVVALAAQGGAAQAKKPLQWLEQNSADWAKKGGPAAYAALIFAAHATGTDPRDFGGANLVTQLGATGPAPQTAAAEKSDDSGDSGNNVWYIIGVGLVAGIGVGFLISGRNKKQQP